MNGRKRVYLFGGGKAEGKATMKDLLGGKGANLAEMNLIGIPVPAGFTITTEACTEYYELGENEVKKLLENSVKNAVRHCEKIMGAKFGDTENPLLLSVRSGARVSMPGMMDTVLNLGLNDDSVLGLARKTGNDRFAYDSYRRFIQMFSDVVLKMKTGGDDNAFEAIIEQIKHEREVERDIDLTTDDLKEMVKRFKKVVKDNTGKDFPDDPWSQLWSSIMSVFDSWNTDRAIYYRKMHGYPSEWGTAVNVQAMVYGNMGDNSATGVAFTRDAATGEIQFNGEYLINAQGEDVVAGTRTPQEITLHGSRKWAELQNIPEEERKNRYPSLEETMPEVYRELFEYQKKLEHHYRDMQDLEFTIQEGKLWILQTRNGKRTGAAMVKIAIDMLNEGMINEKTALLRVQANKLNELLHPVFTNEAIINAEVLAKGLPASPGAASGQIVFSAEAAAEWVKEGKTVILVRKETSPEDLSGMNVAKGILTSRGGMTSHAAVVARGMGKCCVSGAGSITIDYPRKTLTAADIVLKEGDWISLNGTTGEVYNGKLETKDPELTGYFAKLMDLCDMFSDMKVRTNADTPKDSEIARNFGANGIGLCRTEHMFFEGDRIKSVREMILASDEAGRRKALEKLLPMQRHDFEGIFTAMDGLPVTIRLLDPPLHEFVPHDEKGQKEMAAEMGISIEEIQKKIESLQEMNPMLGHRGCRLGITYPEITEMQARAIFEAALNLKKTGVKAVPEIMIPLIGTIEEFVHQEEVIRETAEKVFIENNGTIDYLVGTMIEIPRATLVADKIAEKAEFFSFGTNDLTQMTFGYSRDDAGKFLQDYIDRNILKDDPFQVLDQAGVGQLVKIGVERGRSARKNLKIGICGEHGGEPESVKFCHRTGMDYVSCSPYRVPIARVAAAQAAIE